MWNEEQELLDRYKVFNIKALQEVAAKSIDPKTYVSMTKIAEGGFNKVFRLVMCNGRTAIARIPNLNAGRPLFTTASEVAPIGFAGALYSVFF